MRSAIRLQEGHGLTVPSYGQVSLGQSGTSIPIATIVGLIAGAAVGAYHLPRPDATLADL